MRNNNAFPSHIGQQSGHNFPGQFPTDVYQQPSQYTANNGGYQEMSSPFGSVSIADNYDPFARQPNTAPFGQGFGLEQASQRESAGDGRPPISERLKEKLDTVLNIGGRAVRSVMGAMESGAIDTRASGRAGQITQVYTAASNMNQIYTTLRQDVGSAWDNRAQYGNQALNYAGNIAKEVGRAGGRAALQDVSERTGISYDREAGVSVQKRKLAKFTLKAVFAPHATAASTFRGAGVAAAGTAKQEGWDQVRAARSSAGSVARSYAKSVYF